MSSQKRFTFALYSTPPARGRYIGVTWGGLFISPKAFGDASMMIISEHCPRFFCIINF